MTVSVHEVGGRAAVAEYAPEMLAPANQPCLIARPNPRHDGLDGRWRQASRFVFADAKIDPTSAV
jgi:hypothetical protein